MKQRDKFAFRALTLVLLLPPSGRAVAQVGQWTRFTATAHSSDVERTPAPNEAVSSSSIADSNEGEAIVGPPLTRQSEGMPRRESRGPFSSVTLGLKVSSLGAGADLSTPLIGPFGLRGQASFTSFKYPFNIDGVDYDSRFNLRSGSVSLDLRLTRGGLRVSPGVMYFNNHLEAISGVLPGNYFELGSQGFINSVDDPLNGDAKVNFPRRIAPMLTVGYNLVGRHGGRFTIPIEIGAAYTGAPEIDVVLNGTACTREGCFTFADNQEAQASMQEEIAKLNRNLSHFPVYPIISVGFAYRFGR